VCDKEWQWLGVMPKLKNLFKNITNKDFIRIVVFDNFLHLLHIKEGEQTQKLLFNLREKHELFKYLDKNRSLPIEIAIYSNTMTCKSISINNLKRKDLKVLAMNMLIDKEKLINVVCYENKLSYKNKVILFCDMKLTPIIITIIQELLSVKNRIISTSCWPLWLINSYLSNYKIDTDKFPVALFTIENEDIWEIIVLFDERYVCYRHGAIGNFNKKLETENTIKYVNQVLDINPNNIAIYSITEETILSFRKTQQINMNIVSKNEKLNTIGELRKFDNCINFACIAGLLFFLCSAALNTVKIFSCDVKIANINKIIDGIDKELLNEIKIWDEVDYLNYKTNFDFKNALEKHLQNSQKKLLNVSMEVKAENITVNTITENQ
jgi:hypothetical protein